MNQPDLFRQDVRTGPMKFKPSTRRTDPVTSLEAEARVMRSGDRETHCRKLLNLVRRYPGMTSAELASICGMERHEAARRLSDLKNPLVGPKLVKQGPKRKCKRSGRMAVIWEAT